jgi:hypothetical protein
MAWQNIGLGAIEALDAAVTTMPGLTGVGGDAAACELLGQANSENQRGRVPIAAKSGAGPSQQTYTSPNIPSLRSARHEPDALRQRAGQL